MKTSKTKLTLKQKMFVDEYLIDCNATQAAIRAGYSKKTANRTASENLSKPDIQKAIEVAKLERADRTKINSDYVLEQIQEFLHCSFGRNTIKKVVNIDGEIHSIDIAEYNHTGVAKALELMGKHVQIQAYKERKEVNTNVDSTIKPKIQAMSSDERVARIKELIAKMNY